MRCTECDHKEQELCVDCDFVRHSTGANRFHERKMTIPSAEINWRTTIKPFLKNKDYKKFLTKSICTDEIEIIRRSISFLLTNLQDDNQTSSSTKKSGTTNNNHAKPKKSI